MNAQPGDMVIVYDAATGREKYVMRYNDAHPVPDPLPGESHQHVPSGEVKDHAGLQAMIAAWQEKQTNGASGPNVHGR